jgi:hypothetical protein
MKYLKLYENFNNNIEDTLEDIKWIMIEMTESHQLFRHEKDDCFLYVISNMPSEEDLESAKGRLEDIGYDLVYVGKHVDNNMICWIVKSEFCEEYNPIIKMKTMDDNPVIEDIQKNILLKMWKEEPSIDNNRLSALNIFTYQQMKKVGELFREYLGPKAIQIVDSILRKKEHHISSGGYNFDIVIESYDIDSSDINIKCEILPGGTVSIIMDDGRTLDLEDAVDDEEIGWEIKGEISDCIEDFLYKNLQIRDKTGYGISWEYLGFGKSKKETTIKMKHIDNFRIFESMKVLKNKEELDQLSEKEVDQYTSDFIQSRLFDKQYHNELELYIELRFNKNKKFLQKMIQSEIDGDLSNDETSKKSQLLILSIIKKDGGLEFMNKGMIDDLKKKVGEPKYIK